MHKKSWVTRQDQPINLKNNFYTRIIIEGHKTPTGSTYDLEPGQVAEDVPLNDAEYLLGLIHNQSDCCGGSKPAPIYYFVTE